MLTVTTQAVEALKTMAQTEVKDPEESLRLIHAGSGRLAIVVDAEKEGDQVVEHEGVMVLLVGEELTDVVDGLFLDCQDTSEGLQLTISGPAT